MPDPDRKSISATQSSALYNASPYITPWMLYHYLRGADIDAKETERMDWGKKLQPLVLEQAQTDLKLDVTPNFEQRYIRAESPMGYTGDATVWCPNRGAGAIEVKCVFDYGVWMRDWDGGKKVPRHHELQLQHQLTVGDGRKFFAWGVIAVWVCGDLKYYERARDDAVSSDLIGRCYDFMRLVEMGGREPDPFGSSAELPILAKLFPVVKDKELDLREDPNAKAWAQLAADLKSWKAQENFFKKAADDARKRLLILGRDNAKVLLPNGVTLKLSTRNTPEHMRSASTHTNLSVELLQGEPAQVEELPDGSPV